MEGDATREGGLGSAGPVGAAAVACVAGVVLGSGLGRPWAWLGLAGVMAAAAAGMWARGRGRGARWWGLLGLAAAMAAWAALRGGYVAADHVVRWVSAEPRLATLEGVIVGDPWLKRAQSGPFAPFSWEPPATLLVLEAEAIVVGGARRPASGGVMVRIDEAEHRLRSGQRVRVTGWLGEVSGPLNPGEFDYRAAMWERGIAARMTLARRGNCEVLGEAAPSAWRWLHEARAGVAGAASASLDLGLEAWPRERGLLQTLLLGVWSSELKGIDDDFRAVGLTHVLSISGAHLVILMGIVWAVVRLALPHPSRAAAVVLAVLLLYSMAIPMRAPIVRAAVMAGLFCVAGMSGRRVTAVQVLSLACVLCLAWRPLDLFTPGFQLSFGIVLALLLFTRPVSLWAWPEPLVRARSPGLAELAGRKLVEFLAASVVAFLVALPLVAYHFGIVSPLAVLLSVLSFLPVALMLWVGYVKILLGVVAPSGSIALAGVLAWLADVLISLVEHAARWPGASVSLATPPGLGWTLGATAAVVAVLAGVFAGRRRALACCGVVLVGWLAVSQPGAWGWPWASRRPAATLTMFAVGDGSCFVLRVPDASDPDGEHVLMFDCGSSGYLDVGSKSIVPSLSRVGLRGVDTLMVSHADLDHFSGVLDVVDGVPVGRVVAPPQLVASAEAERGSAAGHLLAELRARGIEPVTATRGWRRAVGGAELELLWPPPVEAYHPERANDSSLVLSVRVAGRRLLLHGDAQDEALGALLGAGVDLRADVCDLPHHGSYTDVSPAWLRAVGPALVLQSSSPARLRTDRWAGLLAESGVSRRVTAEEGMVVVTVWADGELGVASWLGSGR